MLTLSDTLPGGTVQLLEEAIALLAQLRFDADEGASREGKRVTVRVTPEAGEQGMRVLITCYAHGHRLTDWDRLRVAVAPRDRPDRATLLPALDARGQTRSARLEPDAYRVAAYYQLPWLFRLAATPQESALYQQQFLTLQRTMDGSVVAVPQVTAQPANGSAVGGRVVVFGDGLRVLAGDVLALSLIPTEAGLRVDTERLGGCPLGRDIELCLNTHAPGASQPRIIATGKVMPEQTAIHLECEGDQTAGLRENPFQVLYRFVDRPVPRP